MKHNAKRGFTIVELVVVIAVIAILAAVLIPTFSSLIKKANLSSDKQAVREMNLALAADEVLHGKPSDIETVMQVLANAGYNSQNWVCLTQGYEVYWWAEQNRCVLYNSATFEVEYPVEYDAQVMMDNANHFYLYNQNNYNAVVMDISLSSGSGSNYSTISSSGTAASADGLVSAVSEARGTTLSASEDKALTAISSLLGTSSESNEALKSAIGVDTTSAASGVSVYATREITSSATTSAAYASMQVSSVGTSQTLTSSGEVSPNLYYISTTVAPNATTAEKSAAAKAAGEYVYTVFTKINAGQIANDQYNSVAIVLDSGSVFDLSAHEWAPVKTFSGYFGSSDPENPVIINGAKLSAATGYAMTVSFPGTASKYFVTGFFGTIYGNSTIENVKFQNITFTEPASDYVLSQADQTSGKLNSRNTVGIIGGITDNGDGTPANVVLRNITVDSSVSIVAGASAGGLVGYIGAASEKGSKLPGTVTIEGCKVSANITSNYIPQSSAYGPMGGLIALMCRAETVTVTVKDTIFDGYVDGHNNVGALVGDHISGDLVIGEGVDVSGAHLNTKNLTTPNRVAALVGYSSATIKNHALNGNRSITVDPSVRYNTFFNPFIVGTTSAAGYDINLNKV